MKIQEVPIGSKVQIKSYSQNNEFAIRLMELGLIVGTIVQIVRKAPFNGPIELQYSSTRLAIRPTVDFSIFVELLS